MGRRELTTISAAIVLVVILYLTVKYNASDPASELVTGGIEPAPATADQPNNGQELLRAPKDARPNHRDSPERHNNSSFSEFEPQNFPGLADEETSRKLVRENSIRKVQRMYAYMVESLDITPDQKVALLGFLLEDMIANTKTLYSDGIGMSDADRASAISDIIGQSNLDQFLQLQNYTRDYSELHKVATMLENNGYPLSDNQRAGLVDILVDVRDQVNSMPGANPRLDSFESLEAIMNQMDEYERLVVELAPSVLSSKQVELLFDRYQFSSYQRIYSLEQQRLNGDESSLYYRVRD